MLAYVCTPYRAEDDEQFEKQLKHTKEVSREIVASGLDIIVPHLYYPLFLDDNEPDQREAGMASALRLLEKCDVMFVSIKQKVSQGMETEIDEAKRLNIPMRYFENMNILRDILKRLDIGQGQ